MNEPNRPLWKIILAAAVLFGFFVLLTVIRTSKTDTTPEPTPTPAVYKPSLGWVNIDSQAPNKVVQEWLQTEGYDLVRPEYTYGGSRIDFYMEKGEEKYMLEVKGCTLEVDGIGYFPDAPTLRGVKHLHELAKAAQQGYHCAVAFVIQMEGVAEVRPNTATHPQFAEALAQARTAGVKVLFLLCRVEPDGLAITQAREWKN